jgi:hypothetical protein
MNTKCLRWRRACSSLVRLGSGDGESGVDVDPPGDDVGPLGGSTVPPDVAVQDAATDARRANATTARDVPGSIRNMGGGSVAIPCGGGETLRGPDARMAADPRKEPP